MIKEAIATGDTVEAAKEAACRELGVESYEAEFEVLELPVKKTFGLFGGSPAKVRAFVKTKPAQVAAEYLREILIYMGVGNVEFSIAEEENGAVIMTDDGRKAFLSAWQNKKQEMIKHPFLDEKIEWGMAPYVQAMLLTRYLRGDLDEYPPFFWK